MSANGQLHRAWPTELRFSSSARALTITYDDGERFALPYKTLRLESPSAKLALPPEHAYMASAQRLERSRTVSYPPTLSSVRELALDWTVVLSNRRPPSL